MKAILSLCVLLAILYGVLGSRKVYEDGEPKLTLVGCFLQIIASIYFIFALGAACGLVVAMSWKNFFGVLLILTCPLISIFIINLKYQLFTGSRLQLINNINQYFYGGVTQNKFSAFDKQLAKLNAQLHKLETLSGQLLQFSSHFDSLPTIQKKIAKAQMLKLKFKELLDKHQQTYKLAFKKGDNQTVVQTLRVNEKTLKTFMTSADDLVCRLKRQIILYEHLQKSKKLWFDYDTMHEEQFWNEYKVLLRNMRKGTPAYRQNKKR